MEIGSFLFLILAVAGIAGLLIYFDSNNKTERKGQVQIIVYLLVLTIKIFFSAMFLSWLALYLLKEMTHPIVFVGVFWIVGLLSLTSLTLFLNTINEVKIDYFLSTLSFFLIPLITSGVLLKDLLEDWPENRSDFDIYLPTIICFFVAQIFYFLKFRKKIANQSSK